VNHMGCILVQNRDENGTQQYRGHMTDYIQDT